MPASSDFDCDQNAHLSLSKVLPTFAAAVCVCLRCWSRDDDEDTVPVRVAGAELLAMTLHGSDWLQVSLDRHQSTNRHRRTARIALDFKVSRETASRLCSRLLPTALAGKIK